MIEIRTPRLILRGWREADLAPFAAMNADPRVMELMPACLTPAASNALVDSFSAHIAAHGFGRWAVEVPGLAPFIGFVGLSVPAFETPFTPCVEISWRLAADHWGQGLASEAARAALAFGFETLGLAEILSYTVPHNHRSRAVMERIGLRQVVGGDFDHPALPPGHPLERHVLYRIGRG